MSKTDTEQSAAVATAGQAHTGLQPSDAQAVAAATGVPRSLIITVVALASMWFALSAVVVRQTLVHRGDVSVFASAQRNSEAFSTAAGLLKEGSDNLTEAARRYAVTGDRTFMTEFFRELEENRHRERAFEMLENVGGAEMAETLRAAMARSDSLVRLECHAMHLVAEAEGVPERFMPREMLEDALSPREAALSPEDKKLRAIRLLFDENYFAAKSDIWGGANEFLATSLARELAAARSSVATMQRTATRNTLLFTLGLAALFFAFLVAVAACWRSLRKSNAVNRRLVLDLRRERDATIAAEKAKSMFFSMVSHDIRTPLNSIIGFSEMLREGVSSREERTDMVENILFSSHALLDLINDVLDLSKLDAGKMKISGAPCDFPALVSRVAAAFRFQAERKGIEIKTVTGNMPRLVVDEERLRQILFNLVSNAVKFTDKGSVSISASFTPAADCSSGELRFDVTDTGCGLSATDRVRVLEPFVQASGAGGQGGTGLGLTICTRLLAAMSGELSIQSELGVGSTFSATLHGVAVVPAASESPAPKEQPAQKAQTAVSPATVTSGAPAHAVRSVLVVDDVPVNLHVEQAMLKRVGVTSIVIAGSGADALEALEKHGSFDLVLSDLWMPEMDGYQFCSRLRADSRWKELPVYAVTADVEARKKAESSGFNGILLKPLTVGTLTAFLSSLPARA